MFKPIQAWIDPNHHIYNLSGLLSISDYSLSRKHSYDSLQYLLNWTWGPDLALTGAIGLLGPHQNSV